MEHQPYNGLHAAVSWTYAPGRAQEALLRIRKELKLTAGWWNEHEEREWLAALERIGVKP